MPLPNDFLDLATTLVELDPRRPRIINLRRAVSAAYYAVFHRLITDAVGSMLGRGPAVLPIDERNPRRLRVDHEVSRWFDHGQMKQVSGWFSRPATSPSSVKRMLVGGDASFVPPELGRVARYLMELQVARHDADYDPGHALNRTDARKVVRKAHEAFSLCDGLATHSMYRLYLLLLLGGDRMARSRA